MVEIKTLEDITTGVQEVMVIEHHNDGTSSTHPAISIGT